MPSFVFHIRHGQYASDHTIELPCADAARLEASSMCVDMMRDIMTELEANPEWRMEVSDETGEPLYLFRFTAEAFKQPKQ
jgi:hypothetical protein